MGGDKKSREKIEKGPYLSRSLAVFDREEAKLRISLDRKGHPKQNLLYPAGDSSRG